MSFENCGRAMIRPLVTVILHCARCDRTLDLSWEDRRDWRSRAWSAGWDYVVSEGGWLCPTHREQAERALQEGGVR